MAAALLAGCAARGPMLNSERIEATFGSYGIEVVEATDGKRISNLYSTKDGVRTTRTWAAVRFVTPVDPSVRAEHALVVSGRSLGAVFKSRGWSVAKRNEYIGATTLTAADGDVAALMRIDTPREVALHRYTLTVRKGNRSVEYAVITELHHPDYLGPAELARIYGGVPEPETAN